MIENNSSVGENMSHLSVTAISFFIIVLCVGNMIVLSMSTIKISGPGSSQTSGPASSQGLEELVTNNRNYELSTRFNNYSHKKEKEKYFQIKNWMKKILRENEHNIIVGKHNYIQIQLLRQNSEKKLKRRKTWVDLAELKALDVLIKKSRNAMAKWTRV